jgi:hypothetical protein
MKISNIIILAFSMFLTGCITPFIPETEESQSLIVIEGMITDQPEVNTIKISKSTPLGIKPKTTALGKCTVWITDDLNRRFNLKESKTGIYVTDPLTFRGVIGRKYSLHVNTNTSYINGYMFESYPMEMKPVPQIDSIYYEKVIIPQPISAAFKPEGCMIYLDTHDENGNCRFYRWDYTETWEVRIPYSLALNRVCWITEVSNDINVKSTRGMSADLVRKFPLRLVSNVTDRLKVKYSMLLNQYSLNEREYAYWEKLKSMTQDVGSLYDVTPASIPNNLFCIQDPSVEALGFFSVSAKKSKRIFIKDQFFGQPDIYSKNNCVSDTIDGVQTKMEGLNYTVWILEINYGPDPPPYTVTTNSKGCADCTVRGTNVKPDFWN